MLESFYKIVPRNPERTASYYTDEDGVEVVRQLVAKLGVAEGVTIADPFAGSGVLLYAVSDIVKPSRVIGIEINEEPCRFAREALRRVYQNAEVVVECGDAFELGWRYVGQVDLVLSNPPFLRWSSMPNDVRSRLLGIVSGRGYGRFMTRRDPGLHILGFFLIDAMLKPGGYVVTVMPASVLYTEQARGLRQFLLSRYSNVVIVENAKKPSFSRGSGFREVIIAARKRLDMLVPPEPLITTYRYTGNMELVGTTNLFTVPTLIRDNWLSLFDSGDIGEVARAIQRRLAGGELRFLRRDEVVRGVEMYGPDFFFIPNRHWRIIREGIDEVLISGPLGVLSIPRKNLIECLRKPEYYTKPVINTAGYYLLVIGEEPRGDLRRYVEWGEKVKVPALRLGDKWYMHTWRQVVSKKPFGHVFVRDKFDPSKDIIAYYSPRPLCASKDFYIIRTNNPKIAEWYNSQEMRRLITAIGRAIGKEWTRLLEEDLLKIPVPALHN